MKKSQKLTLEAKILLGLFFVPGFSFLITLFFIKDFIPSESIKNVALYGGVLYALFFGGFVLFEAKTAAQKRETIDFIKRLFLNGLAMGLFFLLGWQMIHTFLPSLYTRIFGIEASVELKGYRDYMAGKHAPCRYALALVGLESPFFGYCISKKTYNTLPAKNFRVKVLLKRSDLGLIIEAIYLIDKKPAPTYTKNLTL